MSRKAVLHPQYPYLERALNEMLKHGRTLLQSWVGVGARELQFVFAKFLLDNGLSGKVLVIAPKVMQQVWEEYEGWDPEHWQFMSSTMVWMGQQSLRDAKASPHDCLIIDAGVSGRHTAAIINHEFKNTPTYMSARVKQTLPLSDEEPLRIIPCPYGSKILGQGMTPGDY